MCSWEPEVWALCSPPQVIKDELINPLHIITVGFAFVVS